MSKHKLHDNDYDNDNDYDYDYDYDEVGIFLLAPIHIPPIVFDKPIKQ